MTYKFHLAIDKVDENSNGDYSLVVDEVVATDDLPKKFLDSAVTVFCESIVEGEFNEVITNLYIGDMALNQKWQKIEGTDYSVKVTPINEPTTSTSLKPIKPLTFYFALWIVSSFSVFGLTLLSIMYFDWSNILLSIPLVVSGIIGICILSFKDKPCRSCKYFSVRRAEEWRYETTHQFDDGSTKAMWDDIVKISASDYKAPDFTAGDMGHCAWYDNVVSGNLTGCVHYDRKHIN